MQKKNHILLDDEEQIISEIIQASHDKSDKCLDLQRKISSINLSKIAHVDSKISLQKAIQQLNTEHIGALIVENERDEAIGIFTQTDVLERVILQNLDLQNEKLEDYMTINLITLNEDDSISFALNKLISNSIRHIPICKNGKVLSILTARDIIYWIASRFTKTILNLPPDLHQNVSAEIGG